MSNYLKVIFLPLKRKRERAFSDENQDKVKYRYLRSRNANVLLGYFFAYSVLRVGVTLMRALATIRLSATYFFEPVTTLDELELWPTRAAAALEEISV